MQETTCYPTISMEELVDKYCHLYYIYMTINTINDKRYVGQRHTTREWDEDNYLGSGVLLKKAIKKYGKENFKKIILEYCTKENLNEREIYWIKTMNSRNLNIGYNLSIGGLGVGRGENHPQWHKPRSQEVRDKLSTKLKGRVPTEEHRRKNSEANTGKIISEASRKKTSATLKGKYKKEDHPNYGSKRGDLTKQRIREKKLGTKRSEESKKSTSETLLSKPIKVCPHCGYESNNAGNMAKGHFDNCKQNPNYIPKERLEIVCPHCGTVGFSKSNMGKYHFDNCKSLKLIAE